MNYWKIRLSRAQSEFPLDKEIKEEDVMSGNMIILNAMIDILANDSNANYKEVCEAIGVPVK